MCLACYLEAEVVREEDAETDDALDFLQRLPTRPPEDQRAPQFRRAPLEVRVRRPPRLRRPQHALRPARVDFFRVVADAAQPKVPARAKAFLAVLLDHVVGGREHGCAGHARDAFQQLRFDVLHHGDFVVAQELFSMEGRSKGPRGVTGEGER